MGSFCLTSCGLVSQFVRFKGGSLNIQVQASSPEFDGVHLKTRLTVDVANAQGPIVDYLPVVDLESYSVSDQSFLGKVKHIFSEGILLTSSLCSRTDVRGRAECFLEILPPQDSPLDIRIIVSGQQTVLREPLRVFPSPTVSALSLIHVAFDASESLMITGKQFRSGMEFLINGVTCASLVVHSSSSATCSTALQGIGGPYDVVLRTPDQQEVTLAAAISFVDKTAPAAEWVLVPPARSNQDSFTFQFTGSDNHTVFNNLVMECQLDSLGWSVCSSPQVVTGFSVESQHTFRVRIRDEAGLETILSHSWVYDSEAPTLEMSGFTHFVPTPSFNLQARSLIVSGEDIVNYKYAVITSGSCGSVDFSAETVHPVATGTISFSPTVDGSYVVCGVGQDSAGNWQEDANATASPTLVIDTVVAPFSAMAVSPVSPAQDTMPMITGSTEALATVELYSQASCAGGLIASSTANALGAWSLASSALGADGIYVFSVRATDLAGNSLCSTPIHYELDTTAPVLTFTTPINTRGGASLQIAGTCETGLDVTASGAVLGTPSANCAAGLFSLTVSLSAGEGTKAITLTSVDQAGNSAVVIRDFIRDDTPPTLSIVSPDNGFRTMGAITLTGVCGGAAGDVATVQVSGVGLAVSPQSTDCLAGSYSIVLALSAGEGAKAIVVEQSDVAGNAATISRSFVKDTTGPMLAITDPVEGFRAPNDITLVGTCGDLAGDNTTVVISGAGVSGAPLVANCVSGAFSELVTFTAGDGVKAVVVTQSDDLGHSSTDSRNFERDSSAPLLTILSPASNSRAQATLTLAGDCGTAPEDDTTLNLSGAGLSGPATTTCVAGEYSVVVTLTAGEGNKVITISQTNTIGNTGTVTRTFVRDNTSPLLAFTSPAASDRFQETLVLTGSCGAVTGDSSVLSLSGAGLDSPATTVCNAGSFSEEITLTAGEGLKNITVTQVDSAGNSTTINRDFIRDNTAPVIVISTPALDTPSQTGATLVGTCTEGVGDSTTLTITGAGVASPASTTCVGSAFSVDVVFTAGSGTKPILISQTDSAGNTDSAALSLIRDTTGPVVTLTSLSGGQIIRGGQDTAITWTASDTVELAVNPITIQYSLNGGVNWTTIVASTANTGSYTWSMPGFNSNTARVRVIVVDRAGNSTTATSASHFTVDSSIPILTLTSLTGGQFLRATQVVDITWAATDANFGGTPITLFYSTDEGATWTPIGSAMANSGSYAWTVPDVDSSQYRVRVVATDVVNQSALASSTNNITVDRTPPVVTLTSLTGGQVILGNSPYDITWTASDANFGSTPITIEYSANGGSTWTTVASNRANTGDYSWAVDVADGDQYRVRVRATDAVGLTSVSASTTHFSISSLAPNLTQTIAVSPYYSNTATTVTYGGACEVGYDIVVTGAEAATLACTTGTWTWTTSVQTTDGVRDYTFSQTNAVLTTSRTMRWVRDTVAPTLSTVMINGGSEYTPQPIVNVAVTAAEGSGLRIRVLNAATHAGNCPNYADDNWQNQTSATTTLNHVLSSGDGLKKVCVWLKDQAGNHTVIAGAGVQGQNMDKIDYSSGSPPVATQFEAINDSGGDFQGTVSANANDPLRITWTVSDAEGLANNPIYLDYTTDGVVWMPIESGYGGLSGNPLSYASVYLGFSAPVNTFFRIRMRVKDLAGNTSLEYYSNSFNTNPWSVFAGNKGRGEGGSAKSALVLRHSSNRPVYTMNPKTGDVYYVDNGVGLFKVSAATGIVTKLVAHGTGNISGSGVLNANHRVFSNYDSVFFDNNGWMYLVTSSSSSTSTPVIYTTSRRVIRINPETLEFTTYLNGGSYYGNAGTNATNVFVTMGAGFAFDESNSLYFVTSCSPSSYVEGVTTIGL